MWVISWKKRLFKYRWFLHVGYERRILIEMERKRTVKLYMHTWRKIRLACVRKKQRSILEYTIPEWFLAKNIKFHKILKTLWILDFWFLNESHRFFWWYLDVFKDSNKIKFESTKLLQLVDWSKWAISFLYFFLHHRYTIASPL